MWSGPNVHVGASWVLLRARAWRLWFEKNQCYSDRQSAARQARSQIQTNNRSTGRDEAVSQLLYRCGVCGAQEVSHGHA
ncbi:hypothetical protein BJY52DRAFT_1281739, partial [Lactarius psammicola]